MIEILIDLLLVGALAGLAYGRIGSRPLYGAGLLVAVVGAGACNALIPSSREIAQSTTDAERAGTQFLFDYGPGITVAWLAVAGGCLLALILYRRPLPTTPPPETPG
jgi:hypothetical protein